MLQTRVIPKFTIKNLAVKVPYQMIEEMWGKSSELNTVNLYTKVKNISILIKC